LQHRQITRDRERNRLDRRRHTLVANILSGCRITGILCDIGGVISHPFETTRNKNQIKVTTELPHYANSS
jgi:hypothetical protein